MSAAKPNRNSPSGRESPAAHAFAITPSDSDELETETRAIYVGNGGAIKVKMAGGETVTFSGVPTGTVLPISVDQVFTTDTSASGLVGLY